ncbi:mechanosensitive ion channel [bacterium]|nr:MAG: mechanosensitive ion channel [bacterium]
MSSPPLAVSLSSQLIDNGVFVVVGALVFLVFVVASRLLARMATEQLSRRQVRADVIVVGRRVLVFGFIGFGALIALGIAIRSENVTFAGIVLATIIASFGVQDLLKDYVSGYYVLLERHLKVGDHIAVETWSGTVTQIKLRVTLLSNGEGDVIVVPNAELFNRPVTIHARPVAAPEVEAEASSEPPG